MTATATATPPRTGKTPKPYSRERNNRESVPGYALLHAILDEKARRGENSYAAIIEGLEITQTGWNNIINGSRDIRTLASHAGRRRWIANYLGIPPIAVRVLAGETPISDFQVDVSLDDRLRLTAQELRKDPVWSVYAPQDTKKEWDVLPLKIRMLIKALYDSEKDRIYQWALDNTADNAAKPARKSRETKTEQPPVIDDL